MGNRAVQILTVINFDVKSQYAFVPHMVSDMLVIDGWWCKCRAKIHLIKLIWERHYAFRRKMLSRVFYMDTSPAGWGGGWGGVGGGVVGGRGRECGGRECVCLFVWGGCICLSFLIRRFDSLSADYLASIWNCAWTNVQIQVVTFHSFRLSRHIFQHEDISMN